MKKMSERIITDQEDFFNQNALHEKVYATNNIFHDYSNKEQVSGFNWLADRKCILEYGCGTGTSMDIFLQNRKSGDYKMYGVDIAGVAIQKAKEKYPNFEFYKISNNKIPQIAGNSLNAAYMFHVLHHATDHEDIFNEIYAKLEYGGKFLINDLCSNNPIIRMGRFVFLHLPRFVRDKFSGDDLVVHGGVPEKYKVDIETVVNQLRKAGFFIEEVGYGHLFFFVFAWMDRFVPVSRFKFILWIYRYFIAFERVLLKYTFFQKQAEVFSIKSIKR